MYIQGVSAFHFTTPEQRVKVIDFPVYQNAQKVIGYHSNVPWLPQNSCQFCNLHTCNYLCWKADKDRSSNCWEFSRICRFCHLVQKGPVVTLAISGVTGPNVSKIVHNVDKFILFNILKSVLQYFSPFWNRSTTNEIGCIQTNTYHLVQRLHHVTVSLQQSKITLLHKCKWY